MNPKILIVDDEESIRFTFESFLQDRGYEVETASNYDEALVKIQQNEFDLIFADIILGGQSGIELLYTARKKDPNCPVVMVTGAPEVASATEAVRLGAFDYLSKPVVQETLFHVTDLALKHKALIEEKEKYRSNLEAIFRSVKDAIITVDDRMVLIEINDAAEKICGTLRSDTGKPLSSVATGCNGNCIRYIERNINSNKPAEIPRLECVNKNGDKLVVTINTSPLVDKHGKVSGTVIVMRDETKVAMLERELKERQQFHNIIGDSSQMQNIYTLIEDLADVETTVLITGESGTGKELIAEAIHYKGNRSNKPIVKVNCSALSENLLESELFGHVKGSFTGADRDRNGRFKRADGGILFLDEIGDISNKIQLHLLRVLQEKEFERVGDSTPIKVNVRIIAATNQDLKKKVKLGEFREDLYYRLKVMEVSIPPLRDRREDIPLLTNYFLNKSNQKLNKKIEGVSEDVMNIFMEYPWPGNIRELEHALEHSSIVCRKNFITADHLPPDLKNFTGVTPVKKAPGDYNTILEALKKTGWNKSKAARLLKMSTRTIYRKIEKYNIREDI